MAADSGDASQPAVEVGTVEDLIAARREIERTKFRRDVAIEMVEAGENFTQKKLDERIAETWSEPSDEQLLPSVTSKIRAAVEHLEGLVIPAAEAGLAGVDDKVAKFRELLADAENSRPEAEAVLTAARAELVAWQGLAEDVAEQEAAPTGPAVRATAQPAAGEGNR